MILLVVGLVLTLALWAFIFRRWQRGVIMLLAYIPFAGVVTLSLYPSSVPTLFKDVFFVIPAYLAFLLSPKSRRSQGHVPGEIIFAMLALAALVFVQSFNLSVANWMVAAIGAKVWLFYLPLMMLSFTMVGSRENLIQLLRLMVGIAWVPCCVGIVQWFASMTFGYQSTITAFYGAAAEAATQGFASFDVGGSFFRIPSTFTFVTQYSGYTLAMIVPAYALMKMDSSRKWRKFSNATFWLVILASFLSGARSAYLFVPILLALIYLLEGKFLGLLKMAVVLPLVLLTALAIARIDIVMMLDMMLGLFLNYGDKIARDGLLDAIAKAPLGIGTGMNTGAARFAFNNPDTVLFGFGIENYYAKVVYELGLAGLVIVVSLFLTLISHGYRIHHRIQDAALKSCSAAILAFVITMALNSFKGWQIDLDPVNVYFWVFCGFLLKLRYLVKPNPNFTKLRQAVPKVSQEFSAETQWRP